MGYAITPNRGCVVGFGKKGKRYPRKFDTNSIGGYAPEHTNTHTRNTLACIDVVCDVLYLHTAYNNHIIHLCTHSLTRNRPVLVCPSAEHRVPAYLFRSNIRSVSVTQARTHSYRVCMLSH